MLETLFHRSSPTPQRGTNVTHEADIIISQRGHIGFLLLNRPKALNALTRDMCLAIKAQLDAWADDDSVAAVIIEGEGERSFCAGGDVLKVAQAAQSGSDDGRLFFRDEYRMNAAIHHFPKPYVALLDGITMGGGVGLSIHGRYRVVTERTLFAMPETDLGLIPDVGGSYFLPRLPGKIGLYLALTGYRARAADCLYTDIATHYIPSDTITEMKARLVEASLPLGPAEVGVILDDFSAEPNQQPPLASFRQQIDSHFSHESVGAIIDSLKAETSEWARDTYKTLLTKSPTSLELSFEAYRRGASLSLNQCLQMEYRIVNRILEMDPDFLEGVRAILIDKDRNPTWSPSRLADIDHDAIAAHFSNMGADELTF